MIWNLLLAHLLADFPLQTRTLFELKKRSVWGVMLHSLVCVLLVIILVPHLLLKPVSLLLFFVSHTLFDWLKIKMTDKWPSLDNIIFFILDQIFHLVIILIVAKLWLCENIYSLSQVKYVSLYCIVGPASMILLFYFKRLFYRYETSVVVSKRSWYGAFERMVLFTLVLLPSPFYFAIPFVLMLRGWLFEEERDTALDLVVSTVIAGFCGLALKIFL
ncbi:MAG: DUF3307 domain-containing protein [bacterium]